MVSRKNKIWIGFLSLVDAGLGHIYLGKIKVGLLLYFTFQALLVLFYLVGLASFELLVASIITLLLLRLSIIVHSVLITGSNAYPGSEYHTKSGFIIAFIILSVVFNYGIARLIDPLMPYETRKFASSNMYPKIQKGDLLVIDNNYFITDKPDRNDIVIFHPPHVPSQTHISRIIGLPGDVIKCTDGIINRNGFIADENFIVPDNSINFDELTVPPGKFFILGDNRKESYDSRHYGYVNQDQVFGKPLYIYFSTDLSRLGHQFDRDEY